MKSMNKILVAIKGAEHEANDEIKAIELNIKASNKVVDKVVALHEKANTKLKALSVKRAKKSLTPLQTESFVRIKAEIEVLTEERRTLKTERRALKDRLVECKKDLRLTQKLSKVASGLIVTEEKKSAPPKKRGRKRKINMVWVDVIPD